MADTAARTMRLLSLLQRRRYWPGPELAARLQVSDRTLRRDIERLRALGYSVASDRGVTGGYQLESVEGLAPLLVDDDEAVALAVGLNLAGQGTAELAEAAAGALAKVLNLLPAPQRVRAEALRLATATGAGGRPGGPALDVLATVAGACRDGVRLRFAYRAADGTDSDRYVEPHGLVAVGPRYYLVAYDYDRDDWRTFRVDRMAGPAPTRNAFPPRRPPADDLHTWVRTRHRDPVSAHRVVVDIAVPGDTMRTAYGRWVDVTDLAPGRCRVAIDADDFTWALHILANLEAPFELVAPLALADRLAAVAARFEAAAQAATGAASA